MRHVDADRSLQELPTGAEARFSGQHGRLAVVCANGGQSAEVPGTWSASIEWLVGRLAPLFPDLRFAELRYRVKSWKRLDLCVEDAVAAIEASGAERVLLMGFSMGGAVAVRAAAHPAVVGVLGLAPWLPDQLDLAPLRGRRLDVLHGALDRWLPGIPGVSPDELSARLRTGTPARRRRLVHGHSPRRARDRPAQPVGCPRDAAPRRALGRARGGRGRTLSRRVARRRPGT